MPSIYQVFWRRPYSCFNLPRLCRRRAVFVNAVSFFHLLTAVWLWSQGLENEHQEEGRLLGRFTYDQDGEPLQTFHAPVSTCAARPGPWLPEA